MSINNSYMFSTQRSQNALDILPHSQSGQSGVQLDLSHLVSQPNNGHGNNMMQNSASRLQSQFIMSRQQQQPITSPVQVPPPQHAAAGIGSNTKKTKESVLKTPLSLLNELCAKAKTTPIFTLEEGGPVHLRVYNCTVKVDTQGFVCEATGSGKTKKDAKQEAAKTLLLQMDKEAEKYLIPKVVKEEPVAPVIEVDPEVPGNPVGDLNDLCTKLKHLPPEYEDVAEFGRPHERVYTVACKLGSRIVETGRGRSKKSAKKVAAHRVHKRVLEMLANESKEASLLKEEDNLIEKLSTLTLVSKQEAKKIEKLEKEGWKLTEWVADLRSHSGQKLELFRNDAAQTRLLNPDPMKLLKEIAEEQKFKLEFTELDQGDTDKKTCLIAVSKGNQLITVLMGSAESKTQAKKMAAESFLEMYRSVLISK